MGAFSLVAHWSWLAIWAAVSDWTWSWLFTSPTQVCWSAPCQWRLCLASEDNSLATRWSSLMEMPCSWHCLTPWADLTSKEGTEYLFYTRSHLVTNSSDNRTIFFFFSWTAFLTDDIPLDVFLDVLTFTHFVHFSFWQALFFLVCVSLLDPLFVFQLTHKLPSQPSCVSNMSAHFSVPHHRLLFCFKTVLVFFGSFALWDDLLQCST